jgi:hypothetical protein
MSACSFTTSAQMETVAAAVDTDSPSSSLKQEMRVPRRLVSIERYVPKSELSLLFPPAVVYTTVASVQRWVCQTCTTKLNQLLLLLRYEKSGMMSKAIITAVGSKMTPVMLESSEA